MPAGAYVGTLSVTDLVNNRTRSELLWLTVVSDGAEDRTAPVLHETSILPSVLAPGQTATLMLRMTDDLSAVTARNRVVGDGCRSAFYGAQKGMPSGSKIQVCSKTFHHVADDWYAIDVKVPVLTPSGTYRLGSMELSDAVGNSIYLMSSGET